MAILDGEAAGTTVAPPTLAVAVLASVDSPAATVAKVHVKAEKESSGARTERPRRLLMRRTLILMWLTRQHRHCPGSSTGLEWKPSTR